jgi:hypothetical protein
VTAQPKEVLVIETPPSGFGETTAFPVFFGVLFTTFGGVGSLAAVGRGPLGLFLAVPAFLLGLAVLRFGMGLARRHHRIELRRDRAKISTQGGGKPTTAESHLRDLRTSLRRGSAWQAGFLPRWHQLDREYTTLTLDCGGRRFRVLDNRPAREKELLQEAIEGWIRTTRAKS